MSQCIGLDCLFRTIEPRYDDLDVWMLFAYGQGSLFEMLGKGAGVASESASRITHNFSVNTEPPPPPQPLRRPDQ